MPFEQLGRSGPCMEHDLLVRLTLTQRMHAAVVRLVRGCRADPPRATLDAVVLYDLVQSLEPDGGAVAVARVTLGPDGRSTATGYPRSMPVHQAVREYRDHLRRSRRAVSPFPFDPAYPTAHEAAVNVAERVSVAVCRAVGATTLSEAFDEIDADRQCENAIAAVRSLPGLDEELLARIADQLPGELLRLQREAAHFTSGLLHLADATLTKLHEHERADDGMTLRCHTQLRASDDFSVVYWGDRQFLFAGKQKPVVRKLVECWEAGRTEVSQGELFEVAESDAKELRSVFRPNRKLNPAWGTLVLPVEGRKGFYQLAIEPPLNRRSARR